MANSEMRGAELASMQKGQLNSISQLQGLSDGDCPELKLNDEGKKWWQDAKLGLFIHWGVYSVVGKGEWAYFNELIGRLQKKTFILCARPEK